MQRVKGVRRVVRFKSGVWSLAEAKYDARKRECKAVLCAIKRLRMQLYGVDFVIETDAQGPRGSAEGVSEGRSRGNSDPLGQLYLLIRRHPGHLSDQDPGWLPPSNRDLVFEPDNAQLLCTLTRDAEQVALINEGDTFPDRISRTRAHPIRPSPI
ncbi:hypothetical protein XA68_13701 [Ophiocordyceps unilateralis]|uniref:Reverse transcriptase RNase H-like domain-containing protein n=1 Tax=Ophiocordyceps unilateralis TaxID=268505 RepID=A0A2A9PA84_OPHUN|nr:hypothetical protein XA68_13701 [Ophiocordyceps unilateralis]